MKSDHICWMMQLLVVVLLVSGCAGPAAPAPTEPAVSEPTADVEATVSVAIEATNAAQANMQATIDASVSATVVAQSSVEIAEPAEYVTMSEEELTTLIEESVEEANTASQEMSMSAEQAAADGEVTQEEIDMVYSYYNDAEAAIVLAEEMMDAYMYFYGDLAYDYLELFYLIEDDLTELAAYAAEIDEVLAAAAEQGLALTDESITQMVTAAANIQAYVVENQANIENLSTTVQQQIQERAAAALSAQADQVPANIRETLQAGFQYADVVYGALADDQVTLEELNTIAQMGANAAAGFSQFGGNNQAYLANLISGAEGITANLAQGQNMQAWDGIEQLEGGLGERPEGFTRPERPERPSRP